MKVGESDSLLRQAVDVRSLDFSSKSANIGEAQVIGDNDQEVGTPSLGRRRCVLPHDIEDTHHGAQFRQGKGCDLWPKHVYRLSLEVKDWLLEKA